MTQQDRDRLRQAVDVLCAELEQDDRDLGEILFTMDEEVPSGLRQDNKEEPAETAA